MTERKVSIDRNFYRAKRHRVNEILGARGQVAAFNFSRDVDLSIERLQGFTSVEDIEAHTTLYILPHRVITLNDAMVVFCYEGRRLYVFGLV